MANGTATRPGNARYPDQDGATRPVGVRVAVVVPYKHMGSAPLFPLFHRRPGAGNVRTAAAHCLLRGKRNKSEGNDVHVRNASER